MMLQQQHRKRSRTSSNAGKLSFAESTSSDGEGSPTCSKHNRQPLRQWQVKPKSQVNVFKFLFWVGVKQQEAQCCCCCCCCRCVSWYKLFISTSYFALDSASRKLHICCLYCTLWCCFLLRCLLLVRLLVLALSFGLLAASNKNSQIHTTELQTENYKL